MVLLFLQKPRQFLVAHSVFLCDNLVGIYLFSQINYTKKARWKLRFSGFFLAFIVDFQVAARPQVASLGGHRGRVARAIKKAAVAF